MTSTSANKLANLAKERNREDMFLVENVRFFSNVMTLMVNPSEKITMSEGLEGSPEEFKKIKGALLRITRFNAFIAWIREAISAKDLRINETKSLSLNSWCKKQGIEYPKTPENNIEEDLVKGRASAKVTIEDMAKFFVAEAKASVLGQAVHKDGFIDKALIDDRLNPTEREGSGQDTVIVTKLPLFRVMSNLFPGEDDR